MGDSITVHLVRHGESHANREGRYQGQGDSGLTETGHRQAEEFAALFVHEVPRPDILMASDLPRVRDTAAYYEKLTGLEARIDPALQEMNVGDWSGRTFDEMEAEYPELVAAIAAGEDLSRGGGETFSEARARVVAAITRVTDELAGREGPQVAVLFTSGNPIRFAAAHMLGIPSPGHMPLGTPGNCSVTTFRLRDGRTEVVRYNHDIAGARPADQREIS